MTQIRSQVTKPSEHGQIMYTGFINNHIITEQPTFWGTSKDNLVQISVGKGDKMVLSSSLCHSILETCRHYHIPWNAIPATNWSYFKHFFLMLRWNFYQCNFYPVPFVCSMQLLVKKETLCPLCNHPVSTVILSLSCLRASPFPHRKDQSFSLSPLFLTLFSLFYFFW